MRNKQYSEWLKENGSKLKIAYSYIVVNNLNINSKGDILKALKATHPENTSNTQVDIYLKMLQLFGKTFKGTLKKKLED